MASENEKEFIRLCNLNADEFLTRKYDGFPYVVLYQSDHYVLNDMEEWCWENIGMRDGGCSRNYDNCPLASIDPESIPEEGITFLYEAYHHNRVADIVNTDCISFEKKHLIVNGILSSEQYDELGVSKDVFTLDECNITKFVGFLTSMKEEQIDALWYEMIWDSGLWTTYPHSHKGIWTTKYLGKTNYDYGFQDFCFKNKKDAMYFKLKFGIK